MRAAAGLHGRHLLRIPDVGNVKDSHTAKTFGLRGGQAMLFFLNLLGRWRRLRRKSLRAAIQPSIRHFHGHEHQVFVDGDIALAAGADHRSHQRSFGRIADVENIHAIEIAHEQMIAFKGHVGVRKSQLRDHQLYRFWNLRDVADAHLLDHLQHLGIIGVVHAQLKRVRLLHQQKMLDAHRGFARVVKARRQLVARVGDIRSRHSRRQHRRRLRREGIVLFFVFLFRWLLFRCVGLGLVLLRRLLRPQRFPSLRPGKSLPTSFETQYATIGSLFLP